MNKVVNRRLLGVVFVLAGINHFLNPRLYESIMPDYLPNHRLLIWLSGVAEVFGGVLALLPHTHQWGRWSLLSILVAVFPAHIHMIRHSDRYVQVPLWLLWIRLPLQGVFAWWVWWATDES